MQGIITALVTPFYKGEVDFESLARLLQQQQQSGIKAFVINGTTGESPTLTQNEVEKVFHFVRENTSDDTRLILGAGLNSTQKTLNLIEHLRYMSPHAWLIVVPYYNKPPQQGLIAHFKKITEKFEHINIILYNVPGRTVVGFEPDTILELSRVPGVAGIKEASGQMQVLQKLQKQTPENFYWLSGDDASCMQFMSLGGEGVISVLSHVIPGPMSQMFESLQPQLAEGVTGQPSTMGQPATANQALNDYKKYDTLNALLGVQANPIPVKMALYLMGLIRSPELRLPLVPLSEKYVEKLKLELAELNLLP